MASQVKALEAAIEVTVRCTVVVSVTGRKQDLLVMQQVPLQKQQAASRDSLTHTDLPSSPPRSHHTLLAKETAVHQTEAGNA